MSEQAERTQDRVRAEVRARYADVAKGKTSVISATDLGAQPQPEPILGRDGAASETFDGSSVWLFGDTQFRDSKSEGALLVSNSWSWTDDFDASDGIALFQPVDVGQPPRSLLLWCPIRAVTPP